MNQSVIELVEITARNWRDALSIEVRPEQLPFVAAHEPVALEIVAKCYLRPDGRRWVPYLAVADQRPIGVLALTFEGQEAQVRHFAIDHRVQRRGLGGEMLAAALDLASQEEPGCVRVVLTVNPENEAALAFYKGAGFVDTGITVDGQPLLSRSLTDPA